MSHVAFIANSGLLNVLMSAVPVLPPLIVSCIARACGPNVCAPPPTAPSAPHYSVLSVRSPIVTAVRASDEVYWMRCMAGKRAQLLCLGKN